VKRVYDAAQPIRRRLGEFTLAGFAATQTVYGRAEESA